MKIGIQLYTLRDFIQTRAGLDEMLARVADMGYEGAQFSAVGCMNGEAPEVTAEIAREMLDRHGLVCCATHRPWDRLAECLDEEIQFHKALGCDYAGIGTAPKWAYEGGLEGFQRLSADFFPVVERLGEAGIRFGYHNHAVEFERYAPSGVHAFDTMLSEGPAELKILMDTYWVSHAGIEVVPLISALAGRLPVVHLKDKGVFGWDVDFAPVGEGNFDWSTILPAFEAAGTEWVVVEQDTCRRDVFDSIRSSYDFVAARLRGLPH